MSDTQTVQVPERLTIRLYDPMPGDEHQTTGWELLAGELVVCAGYVETLPLVTRILAAAKLGTERGVTIEAVNAAAAEMLAGMVPPPTHPNLPDLRGPQTGLIVP